VLRELAFLDWKMGSLFSLFLAVAAQKGALVEDDGEQSVLDCFWGMS
jgi:hypothetical protein